MGYDELSSIRFIIPAAPVAKARPRTVTMRNGKKRTYTPAKTNEYEQLGRFHAQQAMKKHKIMLQAVRMVCRLEVPIPKSWSKKKRKEAASGDLRPITRPDVDNYVKAILDCCNGVCFKDDSQVVELVVTKVYSHEPKATIQLMEIPHANQITDPQDCGELSSADWAAAFRLHSRL